MDISVLVHDQAQVIKLRGDLKLGQPVDALRGAIDELLGSAQTRIVLDLTEVPMVDSSGIGLLVRTLAGAKQRGGGVKLVNPSKLTLQTLKIVGLLNLFEIYEDDVQAAASYA